jgi:hypothetical protein
LQVIANVEKVKRKGEKERKAGQKNTIANKRLFRESEKENERHRHRKKSRNSI